MPKIERDAKTVFVVHGRNNEARQAMGTFLRTIGLEPLFWQDAKVLTEKGTPHNLEILEAGFAKAQAFIIILTGDDYARTGRLFENETLTKETLKPQARANVLFEAGMAFGRFQRETILVQLGELRGFTDIAGLHYIRMEDKAEKREALIQALKIAGCNVERPIRDSDSSVRFESTVKSPDGKRTPIELSRAWVLVVTVLVMLALGTILAVAQSSRPREVEIVQNIRTDEPLAVYIIGYRDILQASEKIDISIPVQPHIQYRFQYVARGEIQDEVPITIPAGRTKIEVEGWALQKGVRRDSHVQSNIQASNDQVSDFLNH